MSKAVRVAIAAIVLSFAGAMLVCCAAAQAYDPRAVVPGATITGVILDANGNNIPNVTVELFLDGQMFDVPRNPQQSSTVGELYDSNGRYLFRHLPYGQYLVVAGKPDASGLVHRSNLTVNVDADTVTADIVISDLVIGVPAAPVPTATSLPSPTPYRETCGLGLLLPVLGISTLIVWKGKNG